ncbi:hypothetical protein EZV62_008799 [Acer yangbiense]|uniref:PLP homeostasis protein n=1 Tax=Acer yangbiense TaxID=1000413 RepID=A0A5C7IEV4_9ROSI|nr:hypothetical protein EZV62_008799 [Acer yangbiense]
MAAPAVEGAALTALHSVLLQVQHAAERSGRRPEQIRVVGVSKTKPVSLIRQVYDAGHRCFGENYVQEFVDKAPQLPEDIKRHFIGHLQSNKVKTLLGGVPNLDMVEGVDNVKIANHLDRAVSTLGRNPLKILVQVNTSGEEWLMTIGMPDYTSTPENFRESLIQANCRFEVCKAFGAAEDQCELSMGMSNDFEQAIEMGSTNVRIGSMIFGPRDYAKKHKALKDLKAEIFKRFLNLQELSTGYEIVGVHRNPELRMDFTDWALGARYCALVGDFNGWSPTENCAREGHFGHDDYGYWFISLEDKLREGEKPDELYFQQYNCVDDYDKGDSGVTIEEIFKKANDEYWEPEENEMVKNRFELPAKLYEELFGPNGPQTIEELGEIPDAETRYKAWKEQHKDDPPSSLPPLDIIDNGKVYDIFNIPSDPAWQEKFRSKEAPIAYWLETRKGRKAWLKKYTPAIPHGSKYRVYFNTPDGPLEHVPAWATYVQPGKYTLHLLLCVLLAMILM